jgi:hypothetical protein
MDNASLEIDPGKRAKLYQMAERVLEASAESFMKAGQRDKSRDARRFLEGVKEERKLAISLSEVLSSPSVSLSTSIFDAPSSTREKAVGIDRFDDADVQARVSLEVDEVSIGEDIELVLEMVNTGKIPAALLSIEGMAPASFKISEKPESYGVEDRNFNLKGRKLEPLNTERARLLLNPQTEGIFAFWPRIHYLNEAGETKVYESEPFSVTVVKPLQLMKGRCYLFASHERCLRTFKGLAQQGEPSLAIIRDDPETLIESGDMDKEDIVMLFSRGVRGYEAMSDIQEISWRISQRLHQGVRLVLLDGLEYLISRFGFDSVLRFLQEKRLNMLEADAIMLVPFDLDTVNDRQKAQLRSEMEII